MTSLYDDKKQSATAPPMPLGFSNMQQQQQMGAQHRGDEMPPPYLPMPVPLRLDQVNNNPSLFQVGQSAMAPQSAQTENQAEGQWGDLGGLSDKKTRIRFIRKVYLIITAQLIFTFGCVCIFVFVEPVKTFATKTTGGIICYAISYALFFVLIITFSCCQCTQGLRKVPWNYMLMGGITITLTYMLGMISAFHSIQAVLIAIGITLLITTGVTLFAMQTRIDFTRGYCIMIALCLSLAMLGFGIACAIMYRSSILQAVYGGCGAALMALFLAIDTQMLIGDKKNKYSEEDYVNAALQIYLDICYMFMYLLQLLGAVNK